MHVHCCGLCAPRRCHNHLAPHPRHDSALSCALHVACASTHRRDHLCQHRGDLDPCRQPSERAADLRQRSQAPRYHNRRVHPPHGPCHHPRRHRVLVLHQTAVPRALRYGAPADRSRAGDLHLEANSGQHAGGCGCRKRPGGGPRTHSARAAHLKS
eukprot:Amastigsp_a678637_19.p3 type:complete len:156 gc:universal Amastigsp_a678637_19:1054-1521(+)